MHSMANQLTLTVLVSGLYKSELPPLTVKMATAWKKKRHHPSSLWLPFSSAFLKVTGRSVFLLTHQYFRALHMECSSDFEYRARAYTSSLFRSDMTSSNAQWKLKNQCIKPPPGPPYLMKSVRELQEETRAFKETSARNHRGNIGYVKRIGFGRSSRPKAEHLSCGICMTCIYTHIAMPQSQPCI